MENNIEHSKSSIDWQFEQKKLQAKVELWNQQAASIQGMSIKSEISNFR